MLLVRPFFSLVKTFIFSLLNTQTFRGRLPFPPPLSPPSLPSPISHSFSSLPPIFFIQISPIMKFNAFFLLHYFFLIFLLWFLLPFSLLNLPALSFPFLFCFHYQFSFSLLPSLLFSLFISSTKYGDFHVNKIKFYSKVLTCNTNIFQYFISQFVE